MTFFSKHSVRLREDPIIVPWTLWLHILVLSERLNAFHQYECTPVLLSTTLGGYTTFVEETSQTLLILRSIQNRLRSYSQRLPLAQRVLPLSLSWMLPSWLKKSIEAYTQFSIHMHVPVWKQDSESRFPKLIGGKCSLGALLQHYPISFHPPCGVLIYTCVIPV